MKSMYSMRSPAVKRLMKEAQELREPTELYFTQPLDDNLFEWHFTIRGPENSDFDGGLYHGRIILPPEYPMKPPNVIILTPNGRFETNKKICLSISGHHPESWQPSWSIRTALLAIIGFMPTHGGGAIGSLDYPAEERKKLAKRSNDWNCEHCGNVSSILKPLTEASKAAEEEAKELATQISFKGEKSATENKPQSESASSSSTSTPITTPPNTPVSSNQGFPNMPAMPGQFPFPPFPFPPLANMPNFPQQQQQQGTNFVPRFPYPPQFLPAMFPQMQLPLQNPFAPGNQSAGIQSASQTVNTTPAASVNQSALSTSSGQTNTNDSPSTTSSYNPTSEQEDTSFENTATSVENSATSVENSATTAETVTSEQDSGASTSTVSDGGSSGLRQRHIDNFRQSSHVGQSAELPSENRQSGLRVSTLLIVMLLIGIALLVLRRVYLQREWRFPF